MQRGKRNFTATINLKKYMQYVLSKVSKEITECTIYDDS